jgi:2-alkenal reductase
MLRRLLIFFGLVLCIVAIGAATLELRAAWRQLEEQNQGFVPVARPSQFEGLSLLAATPTPISPEVVLALGAEDQVLINLYQRLNPAVVNIEVTQRTSNLTGVAASASGFVYDTQGHIITNAHVAKDAVEILVTFNDGFVTTAEVTGIDEYSDLAVIRVEVSPDRLVPTTLGDSSLLMVGQRVVAIGNPFGLESSMTRGIVSALGRALPSARLISQTNQQFNNPSIIQVDAVINPGNSGGPLLNYSGEVVGVVSAIRTESGTFEGVAFAIPANTLRRVAPQLIEKGEADYPWLGVSTFPEGPGLNIATLAEPLGLPLNYGVMIEEVTPGSPADEAGLLGGDRLSNYRGIELRVGGDLIVAINGTRVQDLDQLLGYLVENTSPGDVITLTVIRADETLDIDVELGVRP